MDAPDPPIIEIVEADDQPYTNFDASRLSYQEWLDFFFDRPTYSDLPEKERDQAQAQIFWDFLSKFDYYDILNPSIIVGYIERMCLEYDYVLDTYSPEQIDAGLFGMLSLVEHGRLLFEPERTLWGERIDVDKNGKILSQYVVKSERIEVPMEQRVRCIHSMYHLFVSMMDAAAWEPKDSYYFMWWHIILHQFRTPDHNCDLSPLPPDHRQLLEVIFATMVRVLELPHIGCQWSAIHGLNHSHHPGARAVIQRYLDDHPDLSEEDRIWVEGCREGRCV